MDKVATASIFIILIICICIRIGAFFFFFFSLCIHFLYLLSYLAASAAHSSGFLIGKIKKL